MNHKVYIILLLSLLCPVYLQSTIADDSAVSIGSQKSLQAKYIKTGLLSAVALGFGALCVVLGNNALKVHKQLLSSPTYKVYIETQKTKYNRKISTIWDVDLGAMAEIDKLLKEAGRHEEATYEAQCISDKEIVFWEDGKWITCLVISLCATFKTFKELRGEKKKIKDPKASVSEQ